MLGKAEPPETIEDGASRDPDVMVKPTLVEPQYPLCKRYRPDTMGNIRCFDELDGYRRHRVTVLGGAWNPETSVPRSKVKMNDHKGTNRAPKTS